jgi:hypothetical protein
VTLESYTIDWDTGIEEGSSELSVNHGLVVHRFDVVVVDVEFEIGCSLVGVLELTESTFIPLIGMLDSRLKG